MCWELSGTCGVRASVQGDSVPVSVDGADTPGGGASVGRLPLQSLTRSVHAGAGLLTWEQGWHQPACTCKDGRSFRFLTCGQRTRVTRVTLLHTRWQRLEQEGPRGPSLPEVPDSLMPRRHWGQASPCCGSGPPGWGRAGSPALPGCCRRCCLKRVGAEPRGPRFPGLGRHLAAGLALESTVGGW